MTWVLIYLAVGLFLAWAGDKIFTDELPGAAEEVPWWEWVRYYFVAMALWPIGVVYVFWPQTPRDADE